MTQHYWFPRGLVTAKAHDAPIIKKSHQLRVFHFQLVLKLILLFSLLKSSDHNKPKSYQVSNSNNRGNNYTVCKIFLSWIIGRNFLVEIQEQVSFTLLHHHPLQEVERKKSPTTNTNPPQNLN